MTWLTSSLALFRPLGLVRTGIPEAGWMPSFVLPYNSASVCVHLRKSVKRLSIALLQKEESREHSTVLWRLHAAHEA